MRLAGAEAHHLRDVMRLSLGDEVRIFDGQGTEAAGRITALSDTDVELELSDIQTMSREASFPIVLGTAVPKGDRFDWLVEKAVELGVSRLVPLITHRSVVNPGEGKMERMRRIVIEASKQCGRSVLMEVSAPTRWEEFVRRDFSGARTLIADPTGIELAPVPDRQDRRIVLAVGPEGGFTPEEREHALQAGATPVSLGPRILRIETAALALTARLTAYSPPEAAEI